jgi:hypothetical protein
MNKTTFVVLTAVAILAMMVLGCKLPCPVPILTWQWPTPTPTPPGPGPASPTPTPASMVPNYTNATTGVSLWYPENWVHEEFVEEVIFASSPQIITGAELESGAAMMLMRSDLAGSDTINELVETTLVELSFDKIQTSDLKGRTIGGRDGVMVTLEGRPEGADVLMKGFLAGVEHGGWGYLFIAATMRDEWSEHGAVLEQMLSSVELPYIEPVYTNPALRISITYPEGWVFEEQGEQVIFASSEGMLSGAVLGDGAAMVVIRSELGEGQTFQEMEEMILTELSSEDIVIGDRRAYGIGGQDGIMFSFQGTPEEYVRVSGFVAAAKHNKWGYLFIGLSAVEEWCEYESVLHTMLDSVEFLMEH